MVDEEEPFFFGLLSVTTLEQWGLDKSDIAEVTFTYQNFTSANFQQDLYSHLAAYIIHINKYINITSSISIRCGFDNGNGFVMATPTSVLFTDKNQSH